MKNTIYVSVSKRLERISYQMNQQTTLIDFYEQKIAECKSRPYMFRLIAKREIQIANYYKLEKQFTTLYKRYYGIVSPLVRDLEIVSN